MRNINRNATQHATLSSKSTHTTFLPSLFVLSIFSFSVLFRNHCKRPSREKGPGQVQVKLKGVVYLGDNHSYSPFFSFHLPSSPDDTVGDLKKLIAAQTGTKSEKIVLKKWYDECIIGNASHQSCIVLNSHFPLFHTIQVHCLQGSYHT